LRHYIKADADVTDANGTDVNGTKAEPKMKVRRRTFRIALTVTETAGTTPNSPTQSNRQLGSLLALPSHQTAS